VVIASSGRSECVDGGTGPRNGQRDGSFRGALSLGCHELVRGEKFQVHGNTPQPHGHVPCDCGTFVRHSCQALWFGHPHLSPTLPLCMCVHVCMCVACHSLQSGNAVWLLDDISVVATFKPVFSGAVTACPNLCSFHGECDKGMRTCRQSFNALRL